MHPMQIGETEVRGMPYRQLSRDEIIQLSQEMEDLVLTLLILLLLQLLLF